MRYVWKLWWPVPEEIIILQENDKANRIANKVNKIKKNTCPADSEHAFDSDHMNKQNAQVPQ